MDWLEKQNGFESGRAVGHRVVHGMKHTEPEIVTEDCWMNCIASARMTRIICRAKLN